MTDSTLDKKDDKESDKKGQENQSQKETKDSSSESKQPIPTNVVEKPAIEKKVDEEKTSMKPTSKQHEKAQGASSKLALALTIFSLVVAIIGLGLAGYLFQQYEQQQQLLQQNRADMAGAIQRVDEQRNDNRALQRQLDQQTATHAKQLADLQNSIDVQQRQISSQQSRIQSMSTTDRNDWLLAEAEYLLRLANQRLLMGKEVNGALDLLKATDDIFRELDDSGLYAVRQALAEDMAALRAVGQFDLEGLYLQLGALANQADQLVLFEPPVFSPEPKEITSEGDWQQRLQAGFTAAWEKLKSYIRITSREDIYQPMLAPEYETAVRQNVRLMFEQAQMAALSGKQKLYTMSLDKARSWLNEYYTLDKQAALSVIASIDELSAETVEVVLPDISGSLRALKTYMETIHDVSVNKTPENKEQNNKTPDNETPVNDNETVKDAEPNVSAEEATL